MSPGAAPRETHPEAVADSFTPKLSIFSGQHHLAQPHRLEAVPEIVHQVIGPICASAALAPVRRIQQAILIGKIATCGLESAPDAPDCGGFFEAACDAQAHNRISDLRRALACPLPALMGGIGSASLARCRWVFWCGLCGLGHWLGGALSLLALLALSLGRRRSTGLSKRSLLSAASENDGGLGIAHFAPTAQTPQLYVDM